MRQSEPGDALTAAAQELFELDLSDRFITCGVHPGFVLSSDWRHAPWPGDDPRRSDRSIGLSMQGESPGL
jgi:hypothetical protein